MQFKEFPKMARLSREIVITEKIDGTNASVFIQDIALEEDINDSNIIAISTGDIKYTMRVGSRNKWIISGKTTDNFGFANWCKVNANELFKLGEGHHFGEWWGSGIQRNYNLPKGEKRFSLFNTTRWNINRPLCCHVVPELYRGEFNTDEINRVLKELEIHGSYASPKFMNPEGIVVFHIAGNVGFKKTILNDDIPKSLVK